MNTDYFFLFVSFFTIASLFLSLVFVIGIVWRVEMELDLSFKFFTLAVFFLLAWEVLDLLPPTRMEAWWHLVAPSMKLLVAVNMLLGLYFMRDLVRRMDGEKTNKALPPK